MSDQLSNQFTASGTTAERLAFTPSPASPLSGPDQGYTFWDTDLQALYSWDAGGAAWVATGGGGAGTVTNTGTLTSGAFIQGNGGVDIKVASMSTGKLLGRTTAASGAVEEITPGASMKYSAGALNGRIVQVQKTIYTTSATGTTQIPSDDTIPQNTEGTEFFTCAITPTNASNRLLIQVSVDCASSVVAWMIAALFQDTTADALAAGAMSTSSNNAISTITFVYDMAAGTTSSTTFKVRVGPDRSATITMNGAASSRVLGGVMTSSITITEITV